MYVKRLSIQKIEGMYFFFKDTPNTVFAPIWLNNGIFTVLYCEVAPLSSYEDILFILLIRSDLSKITRQY